MFRKKKVLIGGIVILVAIIYLGISSFMGAATYYFTVSEAVGKGDSIVGQKVRVNGKVAPGTVVTENQGRTVKFTVADDGASIPVYYKGTVPDTFKEDGEIVVEGQLGGDGVFLASQLMPKCPSRYEAAEATSTPQ